MSSIIAEDVGPTSRRVPYRIGFVGERNAGKTTVASLVADRLSTRTPVVSVVGDAADVVGIAGTRAGTESDRACVDGDLGLAWEVHDLDAGVDAFARNAASLDAAFVVTTPDGLDDVAAYARVADERGVDVFTVVTRFGESDRDRLRAFDGPDLAEYFYEDPAIASAIDDGAVPDLDDWTVEAILIEALQPDRDDPETALEALARGTRRTVNVEVVDRTTGDDLLERFREAGHHAAYFRCNCRCHDGHVLARRDPETERDPETAATDRV